MAARHRATAHDAGDDGQSSDGSTTAHRDCAIASEKSDEFYRRLWEEQMEVNARKDKFLALLSHELRNPLAPLLTSVSLLQKHELDKNEQSNAIDIIERQARQLVHLVDDLFEVSRFTAGKIALRKELVDLRLVVERAVEATRPLMDERGHDLLVSIPENPLWLHADGRRLEQVFLNLLNNAAKFTPDRGCVWVELTEENRTAVLRVRDSGRGISPESLPIIFDFFTQADSHPAGPQGGLGIGLALVKSFIELHDGKVSAHSDGVGQGSKFTVELDGVTQKEKAASGHTVTTTSNPLRILIVDDHVDAGRSLELLLNLGGHETQVSHTGTDAIGRADHFRPDVILLDIGLPDVSGYDVARQLRTKSELSDLTIIALTGFGGPEDRERAETAGIDQHLTKPVDGKRLHEVLGGVRRPSRST